MNINSANTFVEAIGGPAPDETDGTRPHSTLDGDDWDEPISWGPATSLEGQDAMSRWGDSVPMAGDKYAAFLRNPDAYPMQKEALLGGALRFAGKSLFGGGKSLGKGFMTGLRGLGNLGQKSRGFFNNRMTQKAVDQGVSPIRKRTMAAAGLGAEGAFLAGGGLGQ